MKLEAFAHSVLSRLKGKPVFYGVGGKPGRYQGNRVRVFDLTVGRPWEASVF